MIGAAAPRHLKHPRGEAAVVAVSVTVFEHALENSLGYVRCGVSIAREFDEVTEKPVLPALEQDAEAIQFPIPHPEHQRVIVERCSHRRGGDGMVRSKSHGTRKLGA
jgi:hypothetical protein